MGDKAARRILGESKRKKAGRVSSVSRYFTEIRAFPVLTLEQEQSLFSGTSGDPAASAKLLIESNLVFVARVAAQYRSLGMSYEDLVSEGNFGLIQAVSRYDASKGTRFGTYAVWWIRKSILKALESHSKLVRQSSHQRKSIREIRRAEQALAKALGRTPGREEISARLSRSVAAVDSALSYSGHEIRLEDAIAGEEGTSIAESLADPSTDDPETTLLKLEAERLAEEARNALSLLDERQQMVVAYRFGLGTDGPLSLKEVAERMRISRERVRQIECAATARLRRILRRRRPAR